MINGKSFNFDRWFENNYGPPFSGPLFQGSAIHPQSSNDSSIVINIKSLDSVFIPYVGDHGTIFFYNGIFSQWANTPFYSSVVDQDVGCAEQAMMLFKAETFNDNEAYHDILKLTNPRDQKARGRRISNFDQEHWNEVKFKGVCDISYDKFMQCKPEYRDLLLISHPCELVEASPYDSIWGIGMGVNDKNLLDKSRWGENLLGKALVCARKRIMSDYRSDEQGI